MTERVSVGPFPHLRPTSDRSDPRGQRVEVSPPSRVQCCDGVLRGLTHDRLGQIVGRRCIEVATNKFVQVTRRPARLPRPSDGTGHGDIGGGIEVTGPAGEFLDQLGRVEFGVVVGTVRRGVQRRDEVVE